MRKNPYEKIRRALFILLVVMLVTAACVIGVMLIKHTHRADTGHIAAAGRADAGCNSRTVNHRRKDMTLEEKIANEFQRYFLSMMATSKENIFAHSDEIEVRKQIKNELYEFIGTLNEEQKEILSVQSSLIESVYRYRSDFYSADDDISCQDFLNGWMKSVMS